MTKRLLTLSAFLLGISSNLYAQEQVANGGFEMAAEFPGAGQFGFPTEFGVWAGDVAETVGTRDGIAPIEGSLMLRFIDADFSGPTSEFASSDIRQHIDMTPFSEQISAGAVFRTSASFNRIAGDAETDTEFRITIQAFAGDIANFGVSPSLDRFDASVFTDGDPSTWEALTLEFMPPVGTDFLALRVRAIEDILNDATAPEFDGHYVDDVSLRIVPEPSSLVSCVCGFVALGFYCFRRRSSAGNGNMLALFEGASS